MVFSESLQEEESDDVLVKVTKRKCKWSRLESKVQSQQFEKLKKQCKLCYNGFEERVQQLRVTKELNKNGEVEEMRMLVVEEVLVELVVEESNIHRKRKVGSAQLEPID